MVKAKPKNLKELDPNGEFYYLEKIQSKITGKIWYFQYRNEFEREIQFEIIENEPDYQEKDLMNNYTPRSFTKKEKTDFTFIAPGVQLL